MRTSRRSVRIQLCVSRVCVRTCIRLLAFVCGEVARERQWEVEGRMGGRGPAIADGCAEAPAVGVVAVVARAGVALVLAARM